MEFRFGLGHAADHLAFEFRQTNDAAKVPGKSGRIIGNLHSQSGQD